MRVVFSSAAERDVKRALDFYLNEAGAEVADDLIDQIQAKVERIKSNPETYRVIVKVTGVQTCALPICIRSFTGSLAKRSSG